MKKFIVISEAVFPVLFLSSQVLLLSAYPGWEGPVFLVLSSAFLLVFLLIFSFEQKVFSLVLPVW